MEARRFFYALMLAAILTGCGNISEKNLIDLQSENVITKREAIDQVSTIRSFPLGFWDSIFDRGDRQKAAQIMTAVLGTRREVKDIDLALVRGVGNLGRVMEVPVDLLIERLGDEDRQVRNEAIEALGKIKNKSAVKPLLKLLDGDEPYPVFWALGEIGDKEVVPYLNKFLVSNERWVRFNAYKALVKIGKAEVDLDEDDDETASNPEEGFFSIGRVALERYQDAMKGIFDFIVKLRSSV